MCVHSHPPSRAEKRLCATRVRGGRLWGMGYSIVIEGTEEMQKTMHRMKGPRP